MGISVSDFEKGIVKGIADLKEDAAKEAKCIRDQTQEVEGLIKDFLKAISPYFEKAIEMGYVGKPKALNNLAWHPWHIKNSLDYKFHYPLKSRIQDPFTDSPMFFTTYGIKITAIQEDDSHFSYRLNLSKDSNHCLGILQADLNIVEVEYSPRNSVYRFNWPAESIKLYRFDVKKVFQSEDLLEAFVKSFQDFLIHLGANDK